MHTYTDFFFFVKAYVHTSWFCPVLVVPLHIDEVPELYFPETVVFLPYSFSVRTLSDQFRKPMIT